ncbi:MAG TPA: TonB-dependent receptor, partial [Sunxiuqinia sp.]|nr:TonB-dependent receptor [Sunxiuqinia sp.]
MLRKIHFLLALFTGISGVARALPDDDGKVNRMMISGHIVDAKTGEDLIGASMLIKELGVGTVSNNYGFYSLAVKPGKYTVECRYIGYENLKLKVDLTSSKRIEIALEPVSAEIGEVKVIDERQDENLSRAEMGVDELQGKTVKAIPALLGEVDLIKAIQLLPGVHSTSEGGSGFSVRGGSPDQNLILLDEAPVYNASHLMGFFSVFNNDAIKDLKLYKGYVPARYGGRLASLLDVRMKDGNSKRIAGRGGIGTISSRLTLGGPIKKGRTTFLISGRRTYLDAFLPFSSNEDVKNSRLYFYDSSMKLAHRFNENNRLFISGYLGRDRMKSRFFRMGFGNQTFTMRWNHIFNPRLFMNMTGLWSRYDYQLGTPEDRALSWMWKSNLGDVGFKADFSYFITPKNSLKFGVQSFFHRFNPGIARGVGDQTNTSNYKVDKKYAFEHAVYVSHQSHIGKKLTLKYGLRVTLFQNVGPGTVYSYDKNYVVTDSTYHHWGHIYNYYLGFEPRLGISYKMNKFWSIKGNCNRSGQTIQQASNTAAGSPLDIWFPASP